MCIVVESIVTCLKCSALIENNCVLQYQCHEILMSHVETIKSSYKESSSVHLVDDFITTLFESLERENSLLYFDARFASLFTDFDHSWLLNQYLVDVLSSSSKGEFGEHLLAVCTIFTQDSSNLFQTCQRIVDYLNKKEGAADPPFGCASTLKLENLLKFIIHLLIRTVNAASANRTFLFLYNVLQDVNSLEAFLVTRLMTLALNQSFFLPLISAATITAHDQKLIIQYQFQLIRNCCLSESVGRRLAGFKWLYSILQHIQTKNLLDTNVKDSFILNVIDQLLTDCLDACGTFSDSWSRCQVALCWKVYLESYSTHRRGHPLTVNVIKSIMERFHDVDSRVCELFSDCFYCLDPFDSLLNLCHLEETQQHTFDDFKKLVMASGPCSFTSTHFLVVLKYLGVQSAPFVYPLDWYDKETSLEGNISSWLPDLFFTTQAHISLSQTEINIPNVSQLIHRAANSLQFLSFWALWETARFLILSKLKIEAFGGAGQMLEAFEKTIDLYCAFISDQSVSDGHDVLQDCQILKRMALFTTFLDLFDLLIHVAARGCSYLVPKFPKHSILFFHANFSVCQDWFDRVRSSIVCCNSFLGDHGAVLRNGGSLLDSLLNTKTVVHGKGKLSEMKKLVLDLNTSLLAFKDQDGIIGLKAQVFKFSNAKEMVLDSKVPLNALLDVACLKSANLLESAVKMSLEAPSEYKSGMARDVMDTVIELYDWGSLKQILDDDSDIDSTSYIDALRTWSLQCDSPKEPEIDLIKDGLVKSKNNLIQYLLQSLASRKDEIASKHLEDHRKKYELIERLSLLTTSKPLSSICSELIACQSLFKVLSSNVTCKSDQVKIIRPTSRVDFSIDQMTGSYLVEWLQSYHIFNVLNGKDSMGLDEIGGHIVNLARYTSNFKLARRLVDSMNAPLTLSGKLRALFKKAILLQAEGSISDGVFVLLDILSHSNQDEFTASDCEILAKSCNLFCKWTSSGVNLLQHNLKTRVNQVMRTSLISSEVKSDVLINAFLKHATIAAPLYPFSWFAYAGFCYSVGRKMFEDLLSTDGKLFFSVESSQVEEVLSSAQAIHLKDSFFASVIRDLGEVRVSADGQVIWRLQLPDNCVEKLEGLADQIKNRIYDQFALAAKSYFQFLHLQNSTNEGGSDLITAVLRILRIFIRYAVPLSSLYSQEFASTPVEPWKHVLPQLFSRLHNPDSVIRDAITNLLCKIGATYPHLILYSTLIGVEEKRVGHASASMAQILDSLMNEHGHIVQSTAVWISELRRITVLWEERWIGLLEKTRFELGERSSKLKKDLARISLNQALGQTEKDDIIIKTRSNLYRPVIFQLETLCSETIRQGASTEHEKAFIGLFGSRIEESLGLLNDLSINGSSEDLFQCFYQVRALLVNV